MKLAALPTARSLSAVAQTQVFPNGSGEGLATGEPTASVTFLYAPWRTSWKMLLKPDLGTGSTGLETYQHTMSGLRPETSS